jgi:hypothetical protein
MTSAEKGIKSILARYSSPDGTKLRCFTEDLERDLLRVVRQLEGDIKQEMEEKELYRRMTSMPKQDAGKSSYVWIIIVMFVFLVIAITH